LAKIAVERKADLAQHGADDAEATLARQALARGPGWSVSDVICVSGPRDRAFEEQHGDVCIAIVRAGTFQYRSAAGRELMTPGSLLLGNAGQYFECGHEHGVGDRCLSFQYATEYFEQLAADSRARGNKYFRVLRLPPLRELSALMARACAGLVESQNTALGHDQGTSTAETRRAPRDCLRAVTNSQVRAAAWEELSVELAAQALRLANDELRESRGGPLAAESRVTRIVRMIENHPDAEHDLSALAREAKLSRYHFLRTFQQLTGLTPHQYVLRARLRNAATRLMLEAGRVVDIALDCGFGDVSNFNHAFRAEFGFSPRACRGRRVPNF
jgi:AraC family transcriptional regulator